MSCIIEGVCYILLSISLIALFVWLEISTENVRIKEMRELEEDIKDLPEDVRVQLWISYYREQAERDRF